MRGLRSRRFRLVAVLAATAMIATACSSDDGTDEEPADEGATGTESPTGDDGTGGETGGSDTAFTYNTGIFEDTTTDNVWAYLDPESSVWNAYVLAKTTATMYALDFPDITLSASLAAEDTPPEPVEEDGGWTVTVPLKEANWSDGEPITANDFVFTFEAVRDLGLSGNWASNVPWASEEVEGVGLTAVEAVDDQTFKMTFNEKPGLGTWPHSVGTSAPVMPEHFWGDIVEEARGSEEPAVTLYEASGAGAPAAGPFVFEEREAGAFARVSARDDWHGSGEEVTFEAGEGGSYTVGPYASDETFSLYGGQDPAVLALQEGEVDYLYNPLGMQRGLRERVTGDENLTAVSNASYGMRYMAFNFRKAPMNDKAFRKALAVMIDREFMATNVLQGVAFPLYTFMPPANVKWYDEAKAEELSAQYLEFTGYSEDGGVSRAEEAIRILEEAGYTWETRPEPDAELSSITPGEGLTMPNGERVPELELLAPGPGYDPLRSTYSVWVEQWANDLGIPLTAVPTNFNVIVDEVFPPSGDPNFDMYMLGWSLGNPAFPTYYESFWHSRQIGGNNPMGFENAEFDAAADAFLASTSEEEAYDILWNQMEPILHEELPYIVLFDTPILEFYRSESVSYPFTETLGGLQFGNGYSSVVRSAQ